MLIYIKKNAELHQKEKYMLDLLNNTSCFQENYDKEYKGFSLYEEKFIMIRMKVQKNLKFSKIGNTTKQKFTLPKIKFKLFVGDIKNLLAFWAQFERNT